MDLFLLNGDADDLSLQDMIEKDMKSEFGMSTFDEFSSEFSLSTFDSDVCMKNLEPLFDSLPGMDLDSPCTAATPAASSTHSSCSSSSSLEDEQGRLAMERSIHDISWLSASASHRDLAFDIDTAIMVNPSSVLPSILPSRTHKICVSSSTSSASSVSPLLSSPSPLLSSSPVLLSSASLNNSAQAAVFSSADPGITNYQTTSSTGVSSTQTVYIKTEALHNSVSNPSTVQISHGANTQVTVLRPVSSNSNLVTCNSSTATAVAPAIIATSRHLTPQQQSGKLVSQHRLQISSNSSISPSNLRQQQTVVAQSTGRLGQHNTQVVAHQPITALPTSCNNGQIFRGKPALVRNANLRRNEEKVLPKPAYSYSCLIALALKNSSSGSLPVSEIYSFMCEYFPYFRTAPNGWKNSVRHNLSLNKCFEKIEKPVVSGNNQRKGCLWALNPNKVHKMDEEIQKWSKKDLQGIRDAMNTPDVLGALERGEMKFEATSSTSSCSEDEDEDEEVDPLTLTEPPPPTLATLKFVGSTESRAGAGGQHRGATTGVTVLQGGKTVGQQTTILRANSGTGQQHHQLISAKMRPGTVFASTVTSSPVRSEPEYILPDSTMTEISFQANGALLDDLGNEISLEEDLSSTSIVSKSSSNCNPTSAAVGVVSSPRSLVLRKLPLTAVRSPTLRANYVYSPALTSPHQHHGLNRLVLTNAKMA